MKLRTAALGLIGITAIVGSHGAAGDPPLPQVHYRSVRLVTGWLPYWENKNGGGDGWKVVADNLDRLDQVSLFSAEADSSTGALTLHLGAPDPVLDREIATLHENDVQVMLTVTHFNGMHDLLGNSAALANISDNIVRTLDRYNLDGVDIDFEDFHDKDPADVQRYTQFMTSLADRLHRREDSFGYPTEVAATILARTDRGRFTYADEAALANSPVDQVRIMAYDEYSPGSSKAGACAPLPWVEQVAAFLRAVPAPTWKFVVGVPGYGYDWPVVSAADWTTTGKGRSVTFAKANAAMAAAHVSESWDARQDSPYYQYDAAGVHHVAFYSDNRSWKDEIDSVVAPAASNRDDALGGISEWAFGDEDPTVWDVVHKALRPPFPIYAAIGMCYTRFGGGARFGQPLEPEQNAGPNQPGAWNLRAGRSQQFERGMLYYEWGRTRAYYVVGDLLRRYEAQGGPDGPFGFPISDPMITASGASEQRFEHGTIVASLNEASADAPARLQAQTDIAECAVIAAGAYLAAKYKPKPHRA